MSDGRIVIDITGDASGYEKAVSELGSRTQKQLSSLSGALDKAGGALTKSITVPALTAATAVGSIFVAKGWQRLEAIDTAEAKLKGLGYSASDIESIMSSALTSVKGTAYGLGDAATVAVGALASGISKGEDLTQVLKTIGDVATIAGGDFQGVASVFNKVMSKGKLQGDEILQLSEAGVPVLQILAKHLGVTAEEVSELASKGEIGFSTFEEAMRSAFGGAALASGESMRGTIENTWAAVSRVGAAFLEGGESGQGFFNILKPLLGELTEDIDGMSDTAGEWGAAFGDVVLEGVQALRELLGAFDELSPSQKRQVVELAAIAVAAGPVLKVASKLTAGGSALVGVLGKTAAASDKVIGTARKASTAYSAALSAQQKYAMGYEGSAKVVQQWDASTQSYVKTSGRLKTALASTATGHRAQAAAALASAKAMDVGKVAVRGFSVALKAIAPIAIISGVIALASALASCAQKAQTQAKATAGLEAAASGATVKVNEETGAVEALGGAAAKVDLEGMAQEHAELAQAITDTNQSMTASTGLLSNYGDTVGELAGRTDLSADQIASLKLAVDGINDACGTSYTVAQDAGGAWQVMADGATVAKDAVLDLVNAQIAQIRLDAEKESYKRVYEQLAKDAEAYAAAQADVTAKQEAYNRALEAMSAAGADAWTDGTAQAAADAGRALDDAKAVLAGVEGQMGATQSAANRLEEQMKLTSMASAEGANEMLKLVDGNLQMKAAIQQSGTDLVAFTQSLQEMGFTTEQVATLTPEQAALMAEGWRGGTADMLLACQELGIEVPAALQSMGLAAALETQAAGLSAGQGFTSGLSLEAQNSVAAALSTVGLTTEAFDKLATLAGIEGDEAAVAFANQIAAGQVPAQLAAQLAVQGAGDGLASVNGIEPGNDLASQYYTALGSAANQNSATRAGEEDAEAGHEGIKSRDGDFRTSGEHAGQNWADGLSSKADAARSAAQVVANAAAGSLKFSVPAEGPFSGAEQGGKRSGRHLVENVAAGMLSATASLARAASLTALALCEDMGQALASASMPALEVPVVLSLPGEGPSALSAFSMAAALEDRSGRSDAAYGAKLDLSPVTNALERIEEQMGEVAARTREAYRQPVEVKLDKRTIGRVIRECS